ncbi:MAG TPA: 50S ribosomal protein L19 [Candidatus Gracilibacteria bacterium]|nr:50S ribosomal protein L19 [Candidatus Gracilibacteria bacterium]
MTNLLIQAIEKSYINKKMPVLRPGYQVRVHQKIKEGEKERVQIFEGMVMGINTGHGASKTVTVRKVVEGIGVEKIFPINSPTIAKIEVKKTFKTRRAKISYMRKPGGLSKRLSAKLGLVEKDATHKSKKGMMEEAAAPVVEEVAAAPAEETAAPEAAAEQAAETPAEQKGE